MTTRSAAENSSQERGIAKCRTELPSVGIFRFPNESKPISFEDTTEQVDERIEQVFFPRERDPSFEDYDGPADFGPHSREIEFHNPVLQLFQYHVFPRYDRVTVERPAEYYSRRTGARATARLMTALGPTTSEVVGSKTNLSTSQSRPSRQYTLYRL